MQKYYAIPAPRDDLFRDLMLDDFHYTEDYVVNSCFVFTKCLGIKFEYGMDLLDVKKKLESKWLKEANKNLQRTPTPEFIRQALQRCCHAYIVFEDTAKMLTQLKKGWMQTSTDDVCFENVRAARILCYFNMLTCLHSEGTFVQLLTEGREVWLTSDDERLRQNAKWISKDHTIHKRLTGEKNA